MMGLRARCGVAWVFSTAALASACGDGDHLEARLAPSHQPPPDVPTQPSNHAPTVTLAVSPAAGAAPLAVRASAVGADLDHDASTLQYRWDVDGDGAWDTPFSSSPSLDFTYFVAGSFEITVQVRDVVAATGDSAPVGVQVEPAPELGDPVANLDVDANRDGYVTAGDDVDEETWTEARGAIFLANLDDDDEDGSFDGGDQIPNGAADLSDLAPIVLRRAHVQGGDVGYLSVSPPAAADQVRIFGLHEPQQIVYTPGDERVEIDIANLRGKDVHLGIEAISPRTSQWNGTASLTFEVVRDGQVARDEVTLRVSPVVFPDNARPAHTLFVMPIVRGDDHNRPFIQALESHLPDDVELYGIAAFGYQYDRWVQDNMQLGYQLMPKAGGGHIMHTNLATQRSGGLASFLPHEELGPNSGYWYPGGKETSHNYGGNLEVAPPHVGYPLGRVLFGGGTTGSIFGYPRADRMNHEQRTWLDAQDAQGPGLELSSEWLVVGHIDEIFQFVPNPNQDTGKPYKLVIASPALAWSTLEDVRDQGGGALPVFEGRGSEELTVDAILADTELEDYNVAAQVRIDSVRVALSNAMGLDAEDIVEVPVLYRIDWYGPLDLGVALNPGIQNLVTVNHTLFLPDPEGPRVNGVDVWKHATLQGLQTAGNAVHFVDVFRSYHLLYGEAHCGTNVRLEPYDTPWWKGDSQ